MADARSLRALILAAGRGERMRPLTDTLPKPLLTVGDRTLIEHQIVALARGGIRDVVINLAHLGEQIRSHLENGARYGVSIAYAVEGDRAADALETRGAVVHALHLLGEQPFVVTSADIVTGFDYASLGPRAAAIARGDSDAHLVLVGNRPSHPDGDMGLRDGLARREMTPELKSALTSEAPRYTYGNIGVFAPRLFAGIDAGRAKLFPWMYRFVDAGRVTAELYQGPWHNIGTPFELAELDRAGGHDGV
jgi:N-acetyl-alpha-D-muramate 1-phosphate uridylyltransferase